MARIPYKLVQVYVKLYNLAKLLQLSTIGQTSYITNTFEYKQVNNDLYHLIFILEVTARYIK